MIVQGNIIKKLPLFRGVSKKDKPYFKQTWIINVDGLGDVKVDFTRNDEDMIPNFIAGDNVEFDLKIESRVWQEKYYMSAFTNDFIELRKKVDYTQPVTEEEQEEQGDLPF